MVSIMVATRSGVLIARRASTWTVEKHLADQAPGCMAVDPGKPSQVYCGTADGGRGAIRDRTSMVARLLVRSQTVPPRSTV